MNDYYGFIYLWINTHPDAKKHTKYIGQHVGTIDDGYTGSGVIFVKKYYCQKYKGFWVRNILQYCKNLDELNAAEAYWINRYNAVLNEDFCNCRPGGKNAKNSKQTTDKISRKLKGRIPWNKGKSGEYKQSEKTIKNRVKSLVKNKQQHYEQRDQAVLKYITKNRWWRLSEHTIWSTRKDVNTVKRLLDKQLIKPLYFGVNDIRYVLPEFSLEDKIVEFIKNNGECIKKDIIDYMRKEFNITECKVKNIMTKLKKDNRIIDKRGYRTNLWTSISDK